MNGQRLILAEAVCTPNLIEEKSLCSVLPAFSASRRSSSYSFTLSSTGSRSRKNFPGILVNGDAA